MKHILVCVDYSDVTDRLVQKAAELARALEASVTLFHVVIPEEFYPTYDAGPVPVQTDSRLAVERAEAKLDAWRKPLESAGVAVEARVKEGAPVREILHEIEALGADLVLMGTHGHGPLHNVLFGSVTEGVVRKSAVPVMVVPNRGA